MSFRIVCQNPAMPQPDLGLFDTRAEAHAAIGAYYERVWAGRPLPAWAGVDPQNPPELWSVVES